MQEYLELLNHLGMTLIVSLPKNDPKLARCAFEYGADVVKVHCNVHHHASQNQFGPIEQEAEAFSDMLSEAKGPMGIVLGGDADSAAAGLDKAVEMGFQFISLYGHHTPVSALQCPEVVKMMACDYTYSMEEIQSFRKIGVDVLEASVVHPDGYGERLNGRDLLKYQMVCEQSGLPVVVPTQRKVRPYELAALKQTGVKAIMIGAIVTGQELENIKRAVCDFKEAILQL